MRTRVWCCAATFPLLVALVSSATAPPFTHAATQAGVVARRQDLAAFTNDFFDVDRSYAPAARAEAERRLRSLGAHIGAVSDAQFILALAQIAALADNGHSSMFFRGGGPGMGRAGIRLARFGGDFVVVHTVSSHTDLLGGRLVSVDGHPVAELRDSARTLTGGTAAFRDEAAPSFIESPGQLFALGMSRAAARATYRVRMRDGSEREATLGVVSPPAGSTDFQAGGVLEPVAGGEWRSLLAPDKAPWSLRDPDALMRRRDAPALNAIVIQLRTNLNHGQSIAAFLDAASAAGRKNVVLDMRMNGGGDLTTTHAWMSGLPSRLPPDGRIVILIGPATFSAAIASTGYVKQAGGARVILVGEPPGDRLRFWAEGQGTRLPNSGAFVGTATMRHDYITGCKDFSDCHAYMVRNPIALKNLDPDVSAPWTLDAYAAGRDPGMEAAARALAKPSRP